MTSLHLAVDGGNSKTVAIVCTRSGHVLGAGVSGCGDIYGVADPKDAIAAVMEAVKTALAKSGVKCRHIISSAFRLAGVDWPEDEVYWKNALAHHLPDLNPVSIKNDGFAPLRCGSPKDGLGVAIVVGTGPAVAARASGERSWALSFWSQEPFGGTALGRAALRAVCRAELGIGQQTALKDVLLETYQVHSVEGLLHAFTRLERPRPKRELSRLAPTVLEWARAEDPVARAIISEQARGLADYAAVCAKAVDYDVRRDHFPIVMAGSVLLATNSPFADELMAAVKIAIPTGDPILSALPSVAGAALDAIAEAGYVVDETIVSSLGGTLPDWKANFMAVSA